MLPEQHKKNIGITDIPAVKKMPDKSGLTHINAEL